MDGHDRPDPHGEDIEDLRAELARLTAGQRQLRETIDRLQNYVEATAAEELGLHPAPEQPPPKNGKVLRHILAISDATPQQRQEQARETAELAIWVEDVLVPGYVREARPDSLWCADWFVHAEAVARLHAVWMAWLALVANPEAGGPTGPSTWHRLHLDPALAQLRSPTGPFAACMLANDRPGHTLLAPPPMHPYDGALELRARYAAEQERRYDSTP